MKILKKDNIKQLIIIVVVITICILIISMIQVKEQYNQYKREIGKSVSSIIYKIIQTYPDKEEEIIQILYDVETDNKEKGQLLLKKYGINSEELIELVNLEKLMRQNECKNIIMISSIAILMLILFIIFIVLKDRKIKNIANYLKAINRDKNYSLKIEENNEEELSELQNEIYKIMVMLKEQADNLKTDKQQLSNALSDISHQIKTPLTSIAIMVDILKENKDLDKDKQKEFITEISRQVDWISWLVITLLKLSKLDADTIIFKQDKVKVHSLINIVKQKLSIQLDIKEQELKIFGNEEAMYIGDFNWSVEAITNIVKNCIEHTDSKKTISIFYDQNPLYTEILISDEGNGISKEDLPHIFKRFYKGKDSSKESIGIGLALAKSIIEKQNGDITVKSKLGEGTQFSIKFYNKTVY